MVTYVDINSEYTGNGEPLLLFDEKAINQNLKNLFKLIKGGRFFRPEMDGVVLSNLFENVSAENGRNLFRGIIKAINRWDKRISLNLDNSYIEANVNSQNYRVVLSYSIRGLIGEFAFSDTLKNPNGSSV